MFRCGRPVIISEIFLKKIHKFGAETQAKTNTVFKQSALALGSRWRWVVNATPRPLYPRERPGAHCTGCWVGPRADLEGCGKSRTHQDSSS